MKRQTLVLSSLFAAVLFSSLTLNAQKPRVLPHRAEEKPAPALPQTLPAQVTPQLTTEDLEAFFDGFLPIQLQRDDIAGAVVLVVKDGKVVFAKGYGFSDVKTRKPVTADSTLFRPGSISKTFTWTAVMQLYEQGKIDLDRDINDYLDFKIPATFGKPITMKDLMSHAPGFEETLKELFVADNKDMQPLQEYLATHIPKQIFPPGTTPAYSNYGATLAGYIVQRVSGMPFDDYIEKNIFAPLGMKHSTFRQPLADNLKPMMSSGYKLASQPAKDFEYVQAWPAGSLSTTAEDMSHFIIAHLQNGEYNGVRILKPETAQLMHSRLFGLSPEMNAMAYGFYEESRNGHRIIGHGGDTQWFHSDMHLMLDNGLGFFISYNSAGKPEAPGRSGLWETFLNRYFPYTPPAGQQVASAAEDAKSVATRYWLSRRSESNVAAVTALGQVKVSVNSDGTISADLVKDYAGNPKRFQEIGPMLFREVNGQSKLAFVKDYSGQRVIITDWPIFDAQPVPTLKNEIFNLGILIFAIAMFVLTLLFWPLNAMLRWHYGYRAELTPQYRRLRFWMRWLCTINLAFVTGFALWLTSADENISLFSRHFDFKLHLLQMVGVLGVIGALVAMDYCLQSWKNGTLWFWTRVWNTLLMLACLGFAFFLLNWHMLNFRLNY